MRVDMGSAAYRNELEGANIIKIKQFFDQKTKTEEFLVCIEEKVLYIRSSALLESIVILCASIEELAQKVKDIDHVVKWYQRWVEPISSSYNSALGFDPDLVL